MATLFKNLFKSPIKQIQTIIFRSKGHAFPQFANLPPHYPIDGTGHTYATKIVRKRQIVDPNIPCFEHIEPLQWSDWRMLRDCRRRYILSRYHPTRTFLYTIRKSKALPKLIRESAHEDTIQLPRDSSYKHINNRCILSSRSRGKFRRYKISRHFFRALADYNQLSGVAKACW